MSACAVDVAPLLAKEAIREALYAELDAWRRRDWTAMRAGFAPDAQIEGALFELDIEPVGAVAGTVAVAAAAGAGADSVVIAVPVDDALARLDVAMRGHGSSSLLASNCRIELASTGATARLSALVLAAHEPLAEADRRTRLEALRFEDDWILVGGGDPSRAGWKVSTRRVETLWRAWLDPRRDDRAGDHRHATEWTR